MEGHQCIDRLAFDPFAGSGTTLAVARRLGRHWLGTDLSPDYVANANARVASATLETASPTGKIDNSLFPAT
jgi:DNA modification methylase